mmetsp:Transcript_3487/g.21918  ORF Transcript_3487/g.21918 Transcript_3487/m.21918 type:complete len:139 (+) Transcript_3487:508-924(+)
MASLARPSTWKRIETCAVSSINKFRAGAWRNPGHLPLNLQLHNSVDMQLPTCEQNIAVDAAFNARSDSGANLAHPLKKSIHCPDSSKGRCLAKRMTGIVRYWGRIGARRHIGEMSDTTEQCGRTNRFCGSKYPFSRHG